VIPEKDLRKIPKEILPHIFRISEIWQQVLSLTDSYRLVSAEYLFRIRAGDYRVIYQVLHENREVIVYYIRQWSVAYRGLWILYPAPTSERRIETLIFHRELGQSLALIHFNPAGTHALAPFRPAHPRIPSASVMT